MKVPIETGDEQVRAGEAEVAQDQASSSAQDASGPEASDPEAEERARVEAAIRAGEQAADEDLKADAEKARLERDELQKQLDGVADEIAAAKKEAADSAERLVRLQADWDNYRRRTAQERLAERERAAEKLVVSLLPVLDDMERACSHAVQNNADDAGVMQFVEGIKAVHDKMYSVLGREGVEVIDPEGEPFDPLIHQAVGREENVDVFDETVAQVYQRGYRMGDKVIRAAMVTVTYGGPKRPAPEPEGSAVDGEAPASEPDESAPDASEGAE